MLSVSRILRRMRSLFSLGRQDAELDEELTFHIEMEAEKYVASGMAPAAARERARREFGNVPRHREEARDARGVRPIEDFWHDVRIALRGITRQPTYAIVAIATLAIGIGATTALWSAVYRMLLEPFPYVEASRIVQLAQTDTRTPGKMSGAAPANYIDWKERQHTFDYLAAAEPWSFDYIGREGPERFGAALVTQDFFPLQGLRPIAGRGFVASEFEPGHDNVLILTESVWRARFGGDTAIVGTALKMDTASRVIVGVMPDEAIRPFSAQVWAPKVLGPVDARVRSAGYWTVVGRLAPNVAIERAQDDLNRIATQLSAEYPATNRNTGAAVVSLRDAITGNARRSLLVLLGAVAFVLLIACVNVANLQLAECIRRARELAIRTAIGAGRGRLVRQLLAESALIAGIGTAVALLIAWWGIGVIRAFAPNDMWLLQKLEMNGSTLAFAGALAVFAALTVAIPPIVTAGRIQLGETLAAGRRTGAGRSRRRANRYLVVSEIALALVLMVGAGLLVRSLAVLLHLDPGFQPDGVVIAEAQAWSYYPTPTLRAQFVRDFTDRVGAIPGVVSAATTTSLPLAFPIGQEQARITIEGNPVAPGGELPNLRTTAVSPGYFNTLKIPMVSGRQFDGNDVATSASVVIVNATLAKRYFPNGDAIGHHVSFAFLGQPAEREIVGIVADVRHAGLQEDPVPTIFMPHAQAASGATRFVVRVQGDPTAFQARLRAELTAMNGAMPINNITTMNSLLSQTLKQRRFQIGLLSAFSAIALALAAIGIYGIMSRATSERTHEIGVRLAIGADAGQVRWMVFRSGGALAVFGIAIGATLALYLTRYMNGMLFGISALDPLTYAGAAGVLLLAAILATWLPAWRASRVDPVIALRDE